MKESDNTISTVYKEIYTFYTSKSNVPPEILQKSIDERVIYLISANEQTPAMLIWLFMQFRIHWLDFDQGGVVDEVYYPPLPLQEIITTRLLQMLLDIEKGILKIRSLYNPDDTIGDIPYVVSNGWTVTIYSRAFFWHHIETFTTPDGIEFDPWFFPNHTLCRRLLSYNPSEDIQRNIYGFANAS